jgi:dTDP-glucose 4,6-dehydratase
MSLIVTGGAGFIGAHFARIAMASGLLEQYGNSLKIVDNLSYASDLKRLDPIIDSPQVAFIKADIADYGSMLSTIDSGDVIVNFAAESHVDNSIRESFAFIHSNVVGVDNLLTVARQKNVKKFVQVSTDEVYGSIKEGKFSEDSNLLPSSPYSASKAAADLLCIAAHKTFGLDVCITRAANNYGEMQFPEKIIPLFIKLLLNDEPVTLYGDGLNQREWLHVDDHCDGVIKVLQGGTPGSIYNIGSGISLSNLELTHLLLSTLNKPSSLVQFVSDRLGHDLRYAVNFDRIQRELKYNPVRDIRNDISDLVNSYKLTYLK